MRTATEREREVIEKYSTSITVAIALIFVLTAFTAYIAKGVDGIILLTVIYILSWLVSYLM